MTYSEDDWRKAISKLIQLSKEGEVSWFIEEPFHLDAWTEVDRAFGCCIDDKKYVVSATRKRHYIDEEEFFWVNGASFCVYAKTGYSEVYSFVAEAPRDMSIIDSLYTAAADNYAYKQNALGSLLG